MSTPSYWQNRPDFDLWERTLKRIPTVLGRLAYLARLRNAETDRYEHFGLVSAFGEEAAQDALRHSHLRVLEEWLALPLPSQREDLEEYLETLPQSRRRLIQTWLEQETYILFLPPQAAPAQQVAYRANLQLLLVSLRDSAY